VNRRGAKRLAAAEGSFGGCTAVLNRSHVTIPGVQLGPENKKPGISDESPGFEGKAGDGLLSHHLSVVVPSALQGLTAVFGMGTGVAPAR
jgi:hypothetical protein